MPNMADGQYQSMDGSVNTGMSTAFNSLIRCLDSARSIECPGLHKMSLRSMITSFLMGAVIISVLIFAIVKESSATSFQQLPASAECADPQDVLTPSTGLCQVTNPWALSYLRGQGMSTCAAGLPGESVLQAHKDMYNNFWYPYTQREKVSAVYQSCTPICATQDDTYHSESQMCIVRNPVARMWFAGFGQSCSESSRGATYISKASAGANGIVGNSRAPQFIYLPANSAAVRKFYQTCEATCAIGDALSSDGVHCHVIDPDALAFFGDGNDKCLNQGPGVDSISNTQDGGYYYPKKMGPVVQAWYLTCKRGRAGGFGAGGAPGGGGSGDGVGGERSDVQESYARAVKGQEKPSGVALNIMFPYPTEADTKSVLICNYSGKRYFYKGERDSAPMVGIDSISVNEKCHAVPLSEACQTRECWRRGHVAPCETGMCFAGSRKAVTAGITLVSTGEGNAVCTVVCLGSPDECKSKSVVYIAPTHCGYVQVLPTLTQVWCLGL
jgi:hypothetical protein